MSGPEGSSIKHCIVCAVGIFCPEHSTSYKQKQRRLMPTLFHLPYNSFIVLFNTPNPTINV